MGSTLASHPSNSDFRFSDFRSGVSGFSGNSQPLTSTPNPDFSFRISDLDSLAIQATTSNSPTHRNHISDFRFRTILIWKLKSDCGVCVCGLLIVAWIARHSSSELRNLKSEFSVRMGGWLLPEEPELPDLKSEIWNPSLMGGRQAASHPSNSDFRFQIIWNLGVERKARLPHTYQTLISDFEFRRSEVWILKSGGERKAFLPPSHQTQISRAFYLSNSDFRFQV